MPHLQPLHRSPPPDVSDRLTSAEETKDMDMDSSCTPLKLPLRRPASLSSTSPLPMRPECAPSPIDPLLYTSTHIDPTIASPSHSHSNMQWSGQFNFAPTQAPEDGLDGYAAFHCGPGTADLHSYSYTYSGLSNSDSYNPPFSTGFPDSSRPRSLAHFDPLPYCFSNNITMSDYHLPQPTSSPINMADSTIDDPHLKLGSMFTSVYDSTVDMSDPTPVSVKYESDLSRITTPVDDDGDGDSLQPLYYKPGDMDDTTSDSKQPYAQLIYRALLEAPDHTMILRDIYEWFKMNTDKATNKETKGWQNSIRHNLSMNGAFEKVDQPYEDTKKGFMWKLSEHALREGVKSTTRYRNKHPNKRSQRSQSSLSQGRSSSSRGRRSTRSRKQEMLKNEHRSEPSMSVHTPPPYPPTHSTRTPVSYPSSPYYGSDIDLGSPVSVPGTRSSLELFPLRSYASSPFPLRTPATNTGCIFGQDSLLHSPSPPVDDPRTPDSQGMWDESMSFGANPCVFDELPYSDYAA